MSPPGLELTIPAAHGAPATPAFVILPRGARKGVVVIHEMFGRQPEIDRAVGRLAAAGYAAIAPDLFHRGKIACLRDVFRAMKTGDGDRGRRPTTFKAWNSKASNCSARPRSAPGSASSPRS